jgi:hypothetical protein
MRKKLARAFYCKEEGNKCFKAKEMEKAEARYMEAIGVLQVHINIHTHTHTFSPSLILTHTHTHTQTPTHTPTQLMHDEEINNTEKAQKLEVMIPTLNNLGNVRLQTKEYKGAYIVARSVSIHTHTHTHTYTHTISWVTWNKRKSFTQSPQ